MSFSENFINIMDAVGEKIGFVIDWSSKNVTPYVEQLGKRIVNYEIASSALYLIIGIIFLIIGIILLKKGIKEWSDPDRHWLDDGFLPYIIGGAILVLFTLVTIIVDSNNIITALTLPEKTIIEFIMQYK